MATSVFSNKRGAKYRLRVAYRRPYRNRLLAVQQLLRTKGVYLSRAALRRVPKVKLIRYLRQRFTPEEVAPYLPPRLIFNNHSSQNTGKIKSSPSVKNKETPSIADVVVKDINQPLYPTQEITTPEGQLINQTIFAFDDNHTFDPGLWENLPQQLPPDYSIPDKKFVAVLKKAAKKYGLIDQ